MGQSVSLAWGQDVLRLALTPSSGGQGLPTAPLCPTALWIQGLAESPALLSWPRAGWQPRPSWLYSSLAFAGGLLQLHIWAVVVRVPTPGGAR